MVEMRYYLTLIIVLCFVQFADAKELKLWYEHPAREWVESLPIGNGSLLATNTGGVWKEVLQLNDDCLWSGQTENKNNPEGAKYLGQIRHLLFDGEYKKAERLINEKMMLPHHAHGVHAYQTLGDLNLFFEYADKRMQPQNYKRELDLDRALSTVSYEMGGVAYTREFFSSAPDQLIVVRLTCDKPGSLNFDAIYTRQGAQVQTISDKLIQISGKATDKGNANSGGVSYEAQLQFKTKGGKTIVIDGGIRVENATEVEIRIVSATDYKGDEPHVQCERQLKSIRTKTYANIKKAHELEHQRLFRRVSLDLIQAKKVRRMGPTNVLKLPTDKRLEVFRQGIPDADLIELYFQFGRYLLISCSRPGTQAINLWGKWINTIDPWFNADYHTNINIPMNYWPSQVCNLSECNEPFFDLIDELRHQGRLSAKETYGCDGFVAHHATDAWRFTGAVGRPNHGMWVMTPAWGAIQMWQHYLFNRDLDYLENKTYPIMKEAAEFFVDYLVKYPKTGYLVTGPSCSPENTFRASNGESSSQSMGPTMDLQLVNELLTSCIAASEELNTDIKFRGKLKAIKANLQPNIIGEDGRLHEWIEPYEEIEPGHKHVSHLWGVCEGTLINPIQTPKLALAAKKSLDYRVKYGSAQTPVFRGNTAWIIQSYVRLLAGDDAYNILKYMIGNSSYPNLFAVSVQGVSRKMWETDANWGCTSAIAEMLMQSHAGCIDILPALPKELLDGTVKGLKARGGFEVDISWSNGIMDALTLRSLNGQLCKIKYKDKMIKFNTLKDKEYVFDTNLNE